MIQLQNNFTTPEQSKGLLELGVPAYSADCYYQDYGSIPMVVWTLTQQRDLRRGILKPCWSVGRLIEICKICGSYELAKELYGRALFYKDTVDGIICEMAYEVNIGNIDFSKLED